MSYAYLISPLEPDTVAGTVASDFAKKIKQQWPEVVLSFEEDAVYVLRWKINPAEHSLRGGLHRNLKTISLESGDISSVAQFAIWYAHNVLEKEQLTYFYISSMDQEPLILTPEVDEGTIIHAFG